MGICSHSIRRLPLAAFLALLPLAATAQEAEIVSLVGQGDTREVSQGDWKPAAVRQKVKQGAYVRTRDASQMALLLQDRTQLRLSPNSMVQIKEVAAGGETTKLELGQGRVWAQSKRKLAAGDPMASPPAVTIQTPNAIAAIRGTDWELAVDKDGSATLTVLSGVVDFSNELGRVLVRPNEQARVEPGKAPSKQLLTHARERVQWVTAYRPQPRRWLAADDGSLDGVVAAIEAGRLSEALAALEARRGETGASLLLADVYLSQGRVAEAIALLEPRAAEPRATALLGRAYVVAGRPDQAARVLGEGRQAHPGDGEILLAQGDLLRFQGDAPGARAAYEQVLASQSANAEAWLGLGRIDAEREAVRVGRRELTQALALNPAGPGYQGELATLETFANNFARAEAAFAAALAHQPDDYVALTGLGILRLKQGQPDAALESLLKAGVIEPRYARAALYTGVAYYQLGSQGRALEMFARAAELDPKDPLPHLMRSLVETDRMELGEAVDAARRASELMPYLKSLNQLLNDQKGSANLGAALARFGLEDWAEAYAYNAYNPYWAGSHLFLADQYAGSFNKNSELFLGFMADPTVFGASNRFNTLVASPGHYGSISGRLGRDDVRQWGLSGTANGYLVSPMPMAYFASADVAGVRPGVSDLRGGGDNYTVGLGARPSHELGFFLFANSMDIHARMVQGGGMPMDLNFNNDNRRLDFGTSYKFSPTSQFWLKIGSGKDESRATGSLVSFDLAQALDGLVECTDPTGCYQAKGRIDGYRTTVEQDDLQLRHTFDASSAWQVTWGAEKGRQSKPFSMNLSFPSWYPTEIFGPFPFGLDPIGLTMVGKDRVTSSEVFLSNLVRVQDSLRLQADLSYLRLARRYNADMDFTYLGPLPANLGATAEADRKDVAEWNPRLGLVWNPAAGHTLRLAGQKWRRPAAVNTLAPVDTAGIPVDDRMVAMGGALQRARLQYEWEPTSRTFAQAFLDAKSVRNLATSANTLVPDFNLEDLQRLTSRNRITPNYRDFWETNPEFGEARVHAAGFAVNQLLSSSLSANLRYQASHSRNTGAGLEGKDVPWLPRHYFSAGANWLAAPRWLLGVNATYRSSRYTDEANTVKLEGGWNFALHSYWESADKRWSVEGILANLHADKKSAATQSATIGLQSIYRF